MGSLNGVDPRAAARPELELNKSGSCNDSHNDSMVSGQSIRSRPGPPSASAARQSPKRRLWQRDGNNSCKAPPATAPTQTKELEDGFTSECMKLQQKLGKLAAKKTLAL